MGGGLADLAQHPTEHKAEWNKGLVRAAREAEQDPEDCAIYLQVEQRRKPSQRGKLWTGLGGIGVNRQRRAYSGRAFQFEGISATAPINENAWPVWEMSNCWGLREGDSSKTSIKEAGFAAWTFSRSSETTFC